MARILVTGGLGVVGTWLVRELRERHHDVISCDLAHQPDEVAFGLHGDIREPRYARCDISEFRQLVRLFEHFGRFDYVFHCAAEFGRWNGEDFYETLWRTNVIGTKHLLRLQESQRFRMVHFSSSEVYGDYPHLMAEHITDEVEIKQLNDYALSKWVNEIQIRNAIAQHGVETVVVRLFNTYGPGEYYSPYRSVNCRFLYCALHGLPWTVYRGHARTSTFLADTIRTVANLVEHFKPGETYNIGGDQLHTIEELSDLVLKVTGASPTLVHYADAEPLTTKIKLVDTSKAVRDLDHRNTYSLEEGLRLTADWMRQVYKPNR